MRIQLEDEKKCNHGYTIDEYDPDLVGSQFLFSWGREHIQPVEFNGMDIGPWEVRLTLRPNETIAQLHVRASSYLDQIAEKEYNRKLPKFLERIKTASNEARGYKG